MNRAHYSSRQHFPKPEDPFKTELLFGLRAGHIMFLALDPSWIF